MAVFTPTAVGYALLASLSDGGGILLVARSISGGLISVVGSTSGEVCYATVV